MLGILMYVLTGGRVTTLFKPGTTVRMIWREMRSRAHEQELPDDRYTGF